MNIACCQFDIAWEDKAKNFARVEEMLAGAGLEAGTLVLLPEMFATGFSNAINRLAEEPTKGETRTFLGELARRHRCTVIAGLSARDPDGHCRNRALAISPDGDLLANYAKIHPFFSEAGAYDRGSEVMTFQHQGIPVAPAVCYDLRFPELFRVATRQGAKVLAVIANWPMPRIEHWVTLLRARAIENQAFVAACNRIGTDPAHSYNGRSLIIDPKGTIIADAESAQMVLKAQVDIAQVDQWRGEFPVLKDMRRQFFPA